MNFGELHEWEMRDVFFNSAALYWEPQDLSDAQLKFETKF